MYKYLLYFLIFSFLGWCTEVVFYIFKTGRLTNRGLAKVPFCPIYGIGICLSYLLLFRVKSFFLLSLLCMAVATLVEFFVGFFTDRILYRRLWDYTNEKGNILGYVCPRFSVIWGVVCALTVKIIPRLDRAVFLMGSVPGFVFSFALLVMIVADSNYEILTNKSAHR